MDEDADTNMETDVNSTTADVAEVQTVSGSHRDMETSISVETIKEEILSPTKSTEKQPEKQSDITMTKSPPTPKLVQLKKIVIKAANKTYHIQKPALIASKPAVTTSIVKPNLNETRPSPSPTKQSKDVQDTSSVALPPKTPEKSSNASPQKDSNVKVQVTVESSPLKESSANFMTNSDKKLSKSPENPSTVLLDNSDPIKDVPKVTTNKLSKSPEKPSTVLIDNPSPTKQVPKIIINMSKMKENEHSKLSKKEASEKTSSAIKDSTVNEVPPKDVPKKDVPQKDSPQEDDPQNNTLQKDIFSKNVSKSIDAKISLAKEKDIKIQEKIEDSTISISSSTEISQEEMSNDSQIENNSELSDRDHNKSISRELRSLINSAKESKIINECTQLTSKTRKSRALDGSPNVSDIADKIHGSRRASDNSQISNCSEKSDKVAVKRSMRLQNTETGKGKGILADDKLETKPKDDVELATSTPNKKKEEEPVPAKKKKAASEEVTPKKKPEKQNDTNKLNGSDTFCWRCHWPVEPGDNDKVPTPLQCTVCPRSYHYKCLSVQERNKIHTSKNWVCPECALVLQAESSDTRSPAMKKISPGMLCELLNYALERMKDINGVEPFLQPVDRSAFPDYDTYVVYPMDLSRIQAQIKQGNYGSTEAFLADVLWIQHNSIIFNTLQSKLTAAARALVRSCRAEMGEIEACPECYAAAHARRPTWFTDVCSTPHVLLWAKLKGFPYWPAKCMTVNSSGLVDVRFFGQHDRAWVPARDCFLFSEKDPNNFRTKRQDLLDSMQEAEQHIRSISRKYGKFVYPPFRTLFEISKLNEQLKMMIPSFEGEVRICPQKDKSSTPSTPKDKSRSNSKSSKGSHLEGDTSEGEETPTMKRISKSEDSSDKDKTMEIDDTPSKGREARKRRRSDLEEAVLTVMSSNKDKRKRTDNTDNTPESPSILKPETLPKTTEIKETEKPKETETEKPKVKETEKPKVKEAVTKDDDSSPSTSDKDTKKGSGAKQATIRVISIAKILKNAVNTDSNTPKPKSKSETVPALQEDKTKAQKRRNSRSNKSLNNSNTVKNDKQAEDAKNTSKTAKTNQDKNTEAAKKSSKDRIQFDDDVTLADLAKKDDKLPTISSVKSLAKNNKELTITKTTSAKAASKSVEVTVETPSQSSVFTPTSTDNVKNMKEVAEKLQKLRNNADPPPLGRVGVRAFARMTSPSKEMSKDVEVEVKAEPIDFDDADRQMEKMDLMNAITLKPVNPPATSASSLRDVRVNKVSVGPVKKSAVQASPPKPIEIRPRAKKTFPQPKKPDEGRSELTSKNSMVYIPIQPPVTQAPMRAPRPNGPNAAVVVPQSRASVASNVTSANTSVNTAPTSIVASSGPSNTVAVPTVGNVGNTVHTVPLITSVNGQWTFSLQPMMSVGGVETTKSPPMVNGVGPGTSQIAGQSGSVIMGGGATLAPTPSLPPIAPRPNPDSLLIREPPRLQQKPSGLSHPLDTNAPVGSVPPPSTSGPLTARLNQNAVKLTDFFRTLLEESLEKVDEPLAQLTAARLQLESARWRHQQEINEINHNHELTIAEMRATFEKEKARVVADMRKSVATDIEAAVKLAKAKQWCAKCGNEAQFYCCWNTSYCDYPCQRAHWAQHYAVCTQQRAQDNADANSHPSEHRLQPAPDTLPKTIAAPNLTVGGKLAPSRVYTQEMSPKPAIIMSMVDDGGNQTVKCVGTYKPSPLIINKQILSNEEAAKKVVTSGGYLIVGAANAPTAPSSGNSVVTTSRRMQYF